MKQAFTRLLPLAACLLLYGPAAQAQTHQLQASTRAQKSLPAAPPLPGGVQSLHLPSPGRANVVGKLGANQRLLAPSSARTTVPVAGALAQEATSGPVSEAWVTRYNGGSNSYDGAESVAVDALGNVYVTGYSFGNGSNYDYLTVKLSPTGQQIWEARYNGSGDDVPTNIAVDAAGNVYVSGTSYSATGSDYATIKYSTNGEKRWEARYNGPANSYDYASKVAVDAAGNVYVTGSSDNGSTSSYDYVTLKYNTNGQQLWEARYNGPANSFDLAADLAVDKDGNAVVTGATYSATQSDYATVKYSPTGQVLWEAFYNGPFNSYDLVRALSIDASGNVAVTGTSDSGTSYDYATVRYDGASGQQSWAMRYNGVGTNYDEGTAISTDNVGNVIVAGYSLGSGTNSDYVTLKYDAASGQQLLQLVANPGTNDYDEPSAVVVDRTNNIIVTGRSYRGKNFAYMTIKYDGTYGQQLWRTYYDGFYNNNDAAKAVAVDAAGNVYVTGVVDAEFFTTKLGQQYGETSWATQYKGPYNIPDYATDMTVDAAGNTYVTGTSAGKFVTIKYSPTGQYLWSATYQLYLVSGLTIQPASIAVDAAGNVFVAGVSNSQYIIFKYSPSGQLLWVTNNNGSSFSEGVSLALDAAGNVYVTGTTGRTSSIILTIKYDGSNSRPLWEARYIGNGNNRASDITVDPAGFVYVTGRSYGLSSYDYVTIKYTAATGQQLWLERYNGPGTGNDFPTNIAVDAAGDAIVTGWSAGGTGQLDYHYTTIKYAGANGQKLWEISYEGPDKSEEVTTDLALDAAGNVYVTGYSSDQTDRNRGTIYEYATVKYSPSGQQLWVARFNGGNNNSRATSLDVDAAGSVYVTGSSEGSTADYATVKYSPSGDLVWEARYNGPSNGSDVPRALAVSAAGDVYVTGNSVSANNNNYDIVTIKYTQTSPSAPTALVAATRPTLTASGKNVQELAVYPNPATGPTTVSFRPVRDGAAQVRVYNQLGQQVASLYEGKVHKGQYYELPLHSEKLTDGLYTCSLLVNGQRETVRLLIAH
ncbi:SBBP repeat-containing protein [Hymenobacter sp. YC55]|uniref:SBBP repeat-containing protein n=1 Tax=Hymenobacter sp. YC55 TaxID=3034019 RepID=UPI0023F993DD|nr:SBBP repeat-containing protein [Hymenobacter sp. YC55]MDF7812050.1 SBBP repeat-containing protein [Hymenobacter sp. YC55]